MEEIINSFNESLNITNTITNELQPLKGHYLNYINIEIFSGYLYKCYFEGYIHNEFIKCYFEKIYLSYVSIDGTFYGSINAYGIINHFETCSEIPKDYINGNYDMYEENSDEEDCNE